MEENILTVLTVVNDLLKLSFPSSVFTGPFENVAFEHSTVQMHRERQELEGF